MILMGMNWLTFTYVISLVTCLALNRSNGRLNTFKGIYFLVCYKESGGCTFLLNYFHGSCEVYTEIFDTSNMSLAKRLTFTCLSM